MRTIYLDNVSTTLPDPRVVSAMRPYLQEGCANPSSPHREGQRARGVVEEARAEVALLAGCRTEEVVFTSSATEANNLALKGICRARGRRGDRLLISAVEHPSVLHPARSLSQEGVRTQELPVDAQGRLDLDSYRRTLDSRVCLVSLMHANPEVGTLQPVREAARLAREAGCIFHTDATLTAGLFPSIWKDAPIDLMTVSPHLFHGPCGIAALLVRGGIRLRPQEEGGTQEGGMRAGTEPVALLAGFGAAARIARAEGAERRHRLASLQAGLRRRLEELLEDWVPTGDPVERLPGHLSLCVRYVEGEAVLALLDDQGILAGSGSACTRDALKESHVLRAMGIDPVLGRGSLQFSFSAFNRPDDVEDVARVLPEVVRRLRRISPLTPDGA